MTRKHFKEAARIIGGIKDLEERATVAFKFALMFRSFNKLFDPERFFKACGVNGAEYEQRTGTTD